MIVMVARIADGKTSAIAVHLNRLLTAARFGKELVIPHNIGSFVESKSPFLNGP
jgi:hypothetical protein